MAHRRFVVQCSHEDVDGHAYTLNVTHPSGQAWTLSRRFSELLAAHRALKTSLKDLPPFPTYGVGLGLLFGQEFDDDRVAALQQYFDTALACEDVACAPHFQSFLGTQRPEEVTSVRVRRWFPHSAELGLSSVELEVATREQSSNGPAEEVVVAAHVFGTPLVTSCSPVEKPVRVYGLPCGEEVLFEVRARNGVGSSDAVEVCVQVPGPRRSLVPGTRVRAVWAGDGLCYDAIVKRIRDGKVLVSWLRPNPLGTEKLVCVCESGGDDTAHCVVRRWEVVPVETTGDDYEVFHEMQHKLVGL